MKRALNAMNTYALQSLAIAVPLVLWPCVDRAQEPNTSSVARSRATNGKTSVDETRRDVLSTVQWQRVDAAVERALAWLAKQQQADGSFPTLEIGQPGVTCLCTLSFMAHGHLPGRGTYGKPLEQAIDFALRCQKPNGLVSLLGPEGPQITVDVANSVGEAAAYNHAIASLTISEIYGNAQLNRAARLSVSIDQSLSATLEMQRWPKDLAVDRGGWRYITDNGENDSDLSITGWQLMFLRSARNAGFDVPQQRINEAVAYIRRTFDKTYGTFGYRIHSNTDRTRAMAGAGILALAHAGHHNSVEAQFAGRWLLQRSFADYNGNDGISDDRYHYSVFNVCQGMYQLGSPYWEQFFPRTVSALLAGQRPDGSWEAEGYERDRQFGNCYTTALVVLSLGAPNQLLPIFQR